MEFTNNGIKITLIPNHSKFYQEAKENKISITKLGEVITDIQKGLGNDYREVRVKTIFDPNNNSLNPDYLVLFLLRSDTYTLDAIRVNLDEKFNIASTVDDYNETELDFMLYESPYISTDPNADYVEAVFATSVEDIPSAVAAVEAAAKLASAKGYIVKKLIGNEATVEAYKYWLQKPLVKIFGNVGHGSPQGIVLKDGRLNYTFFSSLSTTTLKNKVIYFNSCQVFNDPLKGSVINVGVQKYIGGITNLLIGESEEVFKAFWDKTITQNKEMTPSLNEAEKEKYPNTGSHGIGGNGSEHITPNGKKIALKALANKCYVCAESGGQNPLIANRNAVDQWESFEFISLKDNKYALKSMADQRYVCAESGGQSPLIANRDAIGEWETFEFINLKNNTYALKSMANKRYVCAESGGQNPLIANRDAIGEWESFEVFPT